MGCKADRVSRQFPHKMYRHHLSQVDDKVKVDQAEVDARHLFRVAKVLGKSKHVFIKIYLAISRRENYRPPVLLRFNKLCPHTYKKTGWLWSSSNIF